MSHQRGNSRNQGHGGGRQGASAERFFDYKESDPWPCVPAAWVRVGTVFLAQDGGFWRFTRPEEHGWWAEPVPDKTVGAGAAIARIRQVRLDCAARGAEHAESESRIDDAESEEKEQGRLARLQAERHRLREELVLLCNAGVVRAKYTPAEPDTVWKWAVSVLALALVITLALGVSALFRAGPEARNTGVILLVICFGLLILTVALILFVPAVFGPTARRGRELAEKLNPSGNLIGCIGLVVFIIIACVVAYVGAAILWHYTTLGGRG